LVRPEMVHEVVAVEHEAVVDAVGLDAVTL
jgi:hypothetical protein